MRKIKTLILDESNWKCGLNSSNPANRRGGKCTDTALLNFQGKMCCLGQFSLQLNSLLKKDEMLDYTSPCQLSLTIKHLSYFDKGTEQRRNTALAQSAMTINDDKNTTILTKVRRLRKLFAEKGFKIIFKRKKL